MPADRRGFFKDLLKEVAGVVQELQAFRIGEALASEEEPELFEAAPPLPAKASRAVPASTLDELSDELGLGDRAADVRRLARTSLRLTAAAPEESTASRLGGAPDLPPAFEWPQFKGRDLGFLGQFDLEQVAALVPESP